MCVPSLIAAATSAFGGTTAAGASAAAATAGAGAASALSTIGTGLGVVGGLMSGISAYRTGKAQEAALREQARTEQELNAVQDQRTRREYMSQMRQQAAELAARGISLDSPTAVLLGQTAAQEMSFASQAVRSEGSARQAELSNEARLARARGTQGLLSGTFSAAGALVSGAPKIWPELLS
ncbi:hypothetical protein SAMN04244548_03005 [Paracoccus pantotrophus]|nr:hypothetical protein SAMN04244548_03005 [Paracoccus pantotrophus]